MYIFVVIFCFALEQDTVSSLSFKSAEEIPKWVAAKNAIY